MREPHPSHSKGPSLGLLAGADNTDRKESPVEFALHALTRRVAPAGTSSKHHLQIGHKLSKLYDQQVALLVLA